MPGAEVVPVVPPPPPPALHVGELSSPTAAIAIRFSIRTLALSEFTASPVGVPVDG